MDTTDAVRALTALAQATRLEAFRLLVKAGPAGLAVGEIAAKLAVPGPTLSFHLKELVNAELIEARQESRYIYYSARFDRMNGLLQFLTEHCCGGDAAACAIPGYPLQRKVAPARATKKPRRANNRSSRTI
jgi:DNA-binding transcriptional ArsR family regulator